MEDEHQHHHHHHHSHLSPCLCDVIRFLGSLLVPWVRLSLLLSLLLLLLLLGVRLRFRNRRRKRRITSTDTGTGPVVAFFHPDCGTGGCGAERVLWFGLRSLMIRYPQVFLVVYSVDRGEGAERLLDRARQRFNVTLPRPPTFVFLRRRAHLEAEPRSRLGLLLGSVLVGWEALTTFVPDLLVDPAGFSFTLPIFRFLGGCKVASYVDMMSVGPEHNLRLMGVSALLYHSCLALTSGVAGAACDVIMVDSARTSGHIPGLWRWPERAWVVLPPCDLGAFAGDEEEEGEEGTDGRRRSVVSMARFGPDEDHELQIRAFAKLWDGKRAGPGGRAAPPPRLVLMGECKNRADRRRVLLLRALSEELGVSDRVDFKVDAPFEELRRELAGAAIGLHAASNRHLGTGVVEYMAAGAVVLARGSGGAEQDALAPHEGRPTGFLADGEDGYAAAMETILALSPAARTQIRRSGRRSVERFSDREFQVRFLAALETPMSQLDPWGLGVRRGPTGCSGPGGIQKDPQGPTGSSPPGGITGTNYRQTTDFSSSL